ncbi:MAG TPA: hypothetical protein VE010_10595, partial [Thermoanaerobaculia bacterium]|nr:hypothetical protein [Thermoanaerobaculia bacterium]
MRPLILVAALFLAAAAAAQSTSPILVPIFYNGPGVNGAEWFTSVQITNRGSQHLDGRGITFLRRSGCPIPEGCSLGHARRGETSEIEEPQSLEGLLLHPSAADADLIDVQAQFGERSRHASGLGVELPVARERDFRTTMFGFPVVPTRGGHRTLLRIYSPDPIAGQKVRVVVRPFIMPTNSFAASYDLTLFVPDTSPVPARPA